MKNYEGWLIGIISKRTPDALCVLGDLLEAGLRQGHCSAADLRDRQFQEPNIIGATFKVLNGMGFVCNQCRRITLTAEKKHARSVPIWELKEESKARDALQKIRSVLLTRNRNEQLSLF